METISVSSLTQFTEAIETFLGPGGNSFWYRGVKKAATHKLLPSLYRRGDVSGYAAFALIEKQLISSFRHRSPPFVSRLPDDDLELLFLMQHHGIPTRLLDWAENPYVALFFALVAGSDAAAEDSAVWVLDPALLNQTSLKHMSHRGGVIQVSDTAARGYKPSTDEMKADPVAMYGVHNSPRIVAQRGVFVVFGQSPIPLEDSQLLTDSPGILRQIVIPEAHRDSMASRLVSMGITDSTLFPDLDGLGRELKRQNEYF